MRGLELAPGEAVRIQSPEAEVPLLLLAMKLLGWQPSWDRVRNILSIHAAPDP